MSQHVKTDICLNQISDLLVTVQLMASGLHGLCGPSAQPRVVLPPDPAAGHVMTRLLSMVASTVKEVWILMMTRRANHALCLLVRVRAAPESILMWGGFNLQAPTPPDTQAPLRPNVAFLFFTCR